MTRTAVLTCSVCRHAERLAMPTDVCVFLHECAGCHAVLRPKVGDCCVFCSYGSAACPPIQAAGARGDVRVREGERVGHVRAAGCRGTTRPVDAAAPATAADGAGLSAAP